MVAVTTLAALAGLASCGGPADTARGTRTGTTTTSPAGSDGGSALGVGRAGGSVGSGAPAGSVASTKTTRGLAEVDVRLRLLARFDKPVALAVRPGDPRPGRIYVAEQGGRVRALNQAGANGGTIDPVAVVDLRSRTAADGERGLLGLAFSPDGSEMYVNYTDRHGDTNVDAFTMTAAGGADPTSRRPLILVAQPFSNHNGGHLVTGPDGMLYIGMGDGGSGGDPQGNGQNPATLLGKLLRIDPRPSAGRPYTVPADNPFAGGAGGRAEIWASGLRNPWGFSFDPATGDLWIADVGQDRVEEINVARAPGGAGTGAATGAGRAANFGWNVYEGSARFDRSAAAVDAVAPFYEYRHGSGADEGCSVTGGVVYRGDATAGLDGAYLFADYCVAGIRAVSASGPAPPAARRLLDTPASVVAFALDRDGEVLVASLDGGVYRLEPGD